MNQQEAIRALYLEGKTIRDRNQGSRTYRFDPTSGNVVNELGQATCVSFSPNAQWMTVEAEPLKVGDTVTDVDDREAKIVFVDDEISLAREVTGARNHWIIYNELWLSKETSWSASSLVPRRQSRS